MNHLLSSTSSESYNPQWQVLEGPGAQDSVTRAERPADPMGRCRVDIASEPRVMSRMIVVANNKWSGGGEQRRPYDAARSALSVHYSRPGLSKAGCP